MNRQVSVFLLTAGIAGLAFLLYLNVQESRLFSISAPVKPIEKAVEKAVSNTQIATVSTTNLLENPRYTGQDSQLRRWQVTARRADQQGSSASSTLILDDVSATLDIPRDNKPAEKLTLAANKGYYHQRDNLLKLEDNVEVTGKGLTLTSNQADANLETRQVDASGNVHLTGNVGPWYMDITSARLTGQQNNTHLQFSGGVKARLTPATKGNPQ